jgi:hypothetical protein
LHWEGLAGVMTDRVVVVSLGIVIPTLAAVFIRLAQVV